MGEGLSAGVRLQRACWPGGSEGLDQGSLIFPLQPVCRRGGVCCGAGFACGCAWWPRAEDRRGWTGRSRLSGRGGKAKRGRWVGGGVGRGKGIMKSPWMGS